MIKRYEVDWDFWEHENGDFVKYDDIKNLIPDNRVTEEGFKELFKTELADLNIYLIAGFIKTAEKQGWIKPEGK